MITYNLPIKCTPQLAIVPVGHTVVDVTDPEKHGSLFLPSIHLTAPQTTRPLFESHTMPSGTEVPDGSGDDWVTITIHCVARSEVGAVHQGYSSNLTANCYEADYTRNDYIRFGRNQLGSLVQHCNAPSNVQESYMQLAGTFKHYYNKRTYLVFTETLSNSTQSFGVPTGARSGNTNYSRAVSEGSLTRTIT